MTRESSPTRLELEKKLRSFVGATAQSNSTESGLSSSRVALGVLAALVTYLWGRRRGRRLK